MSNSASMPFTLPEGIFDFVADGNGRRFQALNGMARRAQQLGRFLFGISATT
ncbi:MAG: hypothetical protein ACO2PK_07635 [Armatimonadota bacterium]